MKVPFNIAVLGSGFGSSFKAMLPLLKSSAPHAKIAVVLSNKEAAPVLTFAKEQGFPHACIISKGLSRQAFEIQLHQQLEGHQIDLIILAGFMRILSPWLIEQWPNKIINVHPSLLPRHKGLMDMQVHQAVIDAKEVESGCSVHKVTAQVDEGDLLIQLKCNVSPNDSAESLKAKVQVLEGPALVQAIKTTMDNRKLINEQSYITT